jgi:hypothetical protein
VHLHLICSYSGWYFWQQGWLGKGPGCSTVVCNGINTMAMSDALHTDEELHSTQQYRACLRTAGCLCLFANQTPRR